MDEFANELGAVYMTGQPTKAGWILIQFTIHMFTWEAGSCGTEPTCLFSVSWLVWTGQIALNKLALSC